MALTVLLVVAAGGPWWVAVPPVVGLFLLGFCWAAFGDDNLRAAHRDDTSTGTGE